MLSLLSCFACLLHAPMILLTFLSITSFSPLIYFPLRQPLAINFLYWFPPMRSCFPFLFRVSDFDFQVGTDDEGYELHPRFRAREGEIVVT